MPQTALLVSYHSKIMRSNLFIPVLFLVVTVLLVIFGNGFVESWKSFLIGVLFTLSALDVGKELIRRATRR